MKIGLVYDLQCDPTDERQAEFDPPATLDALSSALEELGHRPVRLGGAHDIVARPQRLKDVELVFNVAEGADGPCREAWVPTLLEYYGVPYVGSDPFTLSVGLDKALCKRLAMAEGLLTPRWISVVHPRALPRRLPLSFPVIVKPCREGSGRGIGAGAVVSTSEALAQRVTWLFGCCPGPILIEEFIEWAEVTVCVIGNNPPVAYPPIQRPIDAVTRLAYHVVDPPPSQWECPVELDDAVDQEARRIAFGMANALRVRDVARIDLRIDREGRVYFLEINPLPSFAPEGSFGLLAESRGMPYHQVVGEVLDAALRRLSALAGMPHA